MKVLLHYSAGPVLTRRLAGLETEGLSVEVCPVLKGRHLGEVMCGVEVLWHVLEPVTASMLSAAPKLRLIQKIGVGLNTIDLEAAERRHVAVCNMPGTNSQAVAEMTLLLMLSTLRRLNQLDAVTRAGDGWNLPATWQEQYGEMSGRTVGLVGYGAIPVLLAPILRAMGAEVLFTSLRQKPNAVGKRVPLEVLLRESDIVSLHVPLTSETERMLDAGAISCMKSGAILINTARGALIDESALLSALETGRLGGAGLDVFGVEPASTEHPLFKLDNVVVSPHVAWLTQETLERSIGVAVENCRRLGNNADLLHRVI